MLLEKILGKESKTGLITSIFLLTFFLYLFINFLFPYAGVLSILFLVGTIGLLLYSIISKQEGYLWIALAFIMISIILTLVGHPFS